MKTLKKCLAGLLLMVCLCSASVQAAEDQSAETNQIKQGDFLGIAALLVKDGHYQRALMALQNIDLTAENADLIRFYTLQGLAYLNLNDLVAAKKSLNLAVKQGQTDPMIFVYLAQTHYGLKEYQATVNAIDKAGQATLPYPGLAEMKIQSLWNLKHYEAAIDSSDVAQEQYPDDYRFLRRKVFYLVELGLYRNASEIGQKYLQISAAKLTDYMAIGNALRLSRQFEEALSILEIARLNYPENVKVAKLLAHTYIDKGQINTAAQILEQAAVYDTELLAEAGELYRRAGRFYRALSLNVGISDQKTKLKQRLAVLLALNRYEAAVNMQSAMFRTGLLNEQAIRYALAYAYFNIGQYDNARSHLAYLKEPELFKKGIELRRVMAECQKDAAQCV